MVVIEPDADKAGRSPRASATSAWRSGFVELGDRFEVNAHTPSNGSYRVARSQLPNALAQRRAKRGRRSPLHLLRVADLDEGLALVK